MEKCTLLRGLEDILEANLDIVEEIGWDLPELFLNFFDLEGDFEDGIARNEAVKLTMHGFEIVAKNGNAKEVFIKTIELLDGLNYSRNDTGKTDTILDLQIYALVELMSSCLKRINTIYPSKFLAMALGCLLKCYGRYVEHSEHPRFFIRRLYAFARDYIPPLKPTDYLETHKITQREAQSIDDDENYLQRVLLQSFLTNITGMGMKHGSLLLSMRAFHDIKLKSVGLQPFPHQRGDELVDSTLDCFGRILTLAWSFDMDIVEEYKKMKEDSLNLLSRIDSSKSDDDKIQDVLKLSVGEKVKSMFTSNSKTLPRSDTGLLCLTVLHHFENQLVPEMTVQEAVALHIRHLAPGLLSPEFQSNGALDFVLFCDWSVINETSPEEMAKIPHYQMILFLQTLVFYSATQENSLVRMSLFTFLVRVLSLVSESVAYNFLVDTLATAPYENAKAAMINILKDLCLRVRPDVDSLSERLSESTLDGKEKQRAPELPPRRYIQLTSERIDDIYTLVRECIEETLGGEAVETGAFTTLLGYLNFLIGVKALFPKSKIQELVTITEDLIANNPKTEEAKNLEIATLACDSLNSFLKQ